MALRAVPDHPKFSDLKVFLKTNKIVALGALEAVWHFCGRFTPQGNIGKYTDSQIESWVEWFGEPGALIDALVQTKWIDRDQRHRLIVHDWHIHADAATKLALKRSGKDFVLPLLEQCRDSVPTVLGLPVPVPEPVPVPVPEPVVVQAPLKNGLPTIPAKMDDNNNFSAVEFRLDSVRQLLYDFVGSIPDDAMVLRAETAMYNASLEEFRDYLIDLQGRRYQFKTWPYLVKTIDNQFGSIGRKRVVTNETQAFTGSG